MMKKDKQKYDYKGITIISLVITIIVMIILTTVVVNVLINEELFKQAGDAVVSTEKTNEREIVQKAIILAKGLSKTGRITENDLQKSIDKSAGENIATVIEDNGIFVIHFLTSNRYYKAYSNGKVEGQINIQKDLTPGELDGQGTEAEPFVIMSVEDLVYFSQSVNSEGAYKGQYIELGKNLDFKSKLSYDDYTTTEYDVYLGGDGTTGLMEQLCEGGNGFKSIGALVNYNGFGGTFDGNGYEIKNIYGSGLFKIINSATVKNIKVSGKNENGTNSWGIIQEAVNSYIYNCCSNVEIKAYNAGGICQTSSGSKFVNCYNMGKVSGKWYDHVGGIVGICKGNTEIINSYNLSDVEMVNGHSYTTAGGLVGRNDSYVVNMANCYNIGKISSSRYKGSIIGSGEATVENCFFLQGTASSTTGTEVTLNQIQNNEMIENKYIINILNEYVENYNKDNEDETNFIELKSWKIGENGYPSFND